ncbi:hypothetical protein ACFL6C_10850, partial [Myxococcota bacterium]
MSSSGQLSSESHSHPADRSLALDLGMATLTVLALVFTSWLIRDEITRTGSGQVGTAAIGIADALVGSAKRRLGGSLLWERLEAGESIWRGDGVFVPEGCTLDVKFHDGSHLTVSENSLVVVDLPGPGAEARVDIRHGTVAGRAGAEGLRLAVQGSAVEVGKGGVARVSDRGKAGARVEVERGTATVHAKASVVRVAAKQATVVSEGEVAPPVTLPIELVEPGIGAASYFIGEVTTLVFVWKGPRQERVLELADDAFFANVVRTERTEENRVELTNVGAGSYFWRVRNPEGAALSVA